MSIVFQPQDCCLVSGYGRRDNGPKKWLTMGIHWVFIGGAKGAEEFLCEVDNPLLLYDHSFSVKYVEPTDRNH